MDAQQLREIRRELDEAAEWIERLADEIEKTENGRAPALVGIAEIAEMTGMKPNTIKMRRNRGRMPKPVATLAMGMVWLRADIETWWAFEN